MDGWWAAYPAAFILGATHALEVDHMVAVTTFVGGRPRVTAAVGFGVRWGLGHAAVVLVAGTVLAWSGVTLPAVARDWGELAVGGSMMALGIWASRAAARLHLHDPLHHGGHGHLHAHAPAQHPHDHNHVDAGRRHRHLSTLIGAVHGLAGTAPIVALVPVTLAADLGSAITYLAMFGLGNVVAMGVYAALAAVTFARALGVVTTARWLARVTALAALAVGAWWVIAATASLTV